ncbi:Tetraacyldisaccharide 4'-kinase [Hartmannibacter diazotrophicus]|uniref:Tetraacyldisaccharide 4'-kinase n=1 Tax=Hartmannibacter diazotrophicus TaxID=1482074 RepID=A0A2C9D3B0_9HYPH|nr:tetraacyldisaccharide 4'-kinase [Hartmannibacter diazotrophicus]SON54648.1 Tetraacyldisaccharide 4'-kinase [Hartmannibacter diazotrophicus]
MQAPAFWWQPPGLASALLSPVAAIWGRLVAAKMERDGVAFDCPVLCVGNFVAGGAGKTPTALALGQIAAGRGLRAVYLTRGYGGRLTGPLKVDPGHHTAADVGDEPLLLARQAPVILSRRREEAAGLIAGLGADLVIMDDGFQNPSVKKNLSLVVVDGPRGIGNGRVMPAGPLRAPLEAQVRAMDAMLLIGEGAAGERVASIVEAAGKPVHRARLRFREGDLPKKGESLLAFAGIGHPDRFFDQLRAEGFTVSEQVAFADHHPLSEAEASGLLRTAEERGLTLVTTEKDLARLVGLSGARGELLARTSAIGVDLVFDDEPALTELVLGAMSGACR